MPLHILPNKDIFGTNLRPAQSIIVLTKVFLVASSRNQHKAISWESAGPASQSITKILNDSSDSGPGGGGGVLILTSLPSFLSFSVEMVEIAIAPALGPQYFPKPQHPYPLAPSSRRVSRGPLGPDVQPLSSCPTGFGQRG